jgi:hypothetical protein
MKMLMKDFALNHLTLELLDAPAMSWQKIAEQQVEQGNEGLKNLQNAVWELDAVIQKATRLRAYLWARSQGFDHVKGVKESNKLVRPIRKNLGFTIPKHDILF